MDTLTGSISRFIYHTDTFAIFKMNGVTVLGEVACLKEGDYLRLTGEWQEHPKYGRQFRIEAWEKPVPSTREAAIAFLSCGLIKGIGPVLAERIVDALGPDAIDKIIEEPDVLKKVKGIGKKAQRVYEQLAETYAVQQALSKLISFGITSKTALKAYKQFGRVAPDYVQKNPYCLTEIDQIGFHKADDIAEKLGLDRDSPLRIKAGILHVLDEALWNEGHTYLPRDVLTRRAVSLLNHNSITVSEAAVVGEISAVDNLCGEEKVALTWVRQYEQEVAGDVRRLSRRFSVPPLPDNLLEGMTLTRDQKRAVETALGNGFSILTGGPGVGKTQTVRAILRAFSLQNPWGEAILCAPTGRAARRLSELTGHPAHTIHRLLGIGKDRVLHNRDNPLKADLVIVDETSMMCLVTAKRLLEAIPEGARVLFVGDPDQLPPVGPGNVLRDLLGKVPTVRLTKIFRQAAESSIVTNAHRINRGEMPLVDRSKADFVFLEREDPEQIVRCVKTCVSQLGYSPMDIQVLTPMRRGPLGTVELNKQIQEERKGRGLKHGRYTYRVGDKVIHTRNNYGKMVFNGDIGIVTRVKPDGLVVRYNGDEVQYEMQDLAELEPAWAVTTFKAQGSEFKAAIVIVSTAHYIMLHRSLVYTAITRAKEKVILVGTKKALAIAVKNNKPVQRYTMLASALAQAPKQTSAV